MNLITVDPGKNFVAIASFIGQEFHAAAYIPMVPFNGAIQMIYTIIRDMAPKINGSEFRITIEIPQIYTQKKLKGDPNDLIQVAVSAGAVGAASVGAGVQAIKWILPATWKGQRPKDIDNKYTLSLLSERERANYDSGGFTTNQAHNVIDAIGIGLWDLGRRK